MPKRSPAPATARYVVVTSSTGLPKARTLTVSSPLSLEDGGDGNQVTLGVSGATGSDRGAVALAGQLGGTADAPDVRGLRIPGVEGGEGPQLLSMDHVADGQVLARDGDSLTGLDVLPKAGGTLSGNLGMDGHRVTGLASGTDPDDAATFGQVASMVNGLDWQDSVLRSDLTAPPTSPGPSAGDRFLVATGASGAWSGQSGKIGVFGGSSWTFISPTTGMTVHVDGGPAGGTDMTYSGSAWVNIGASVDHNATLNRSDAAAHPQYQLGSEKDATSGYAGLDGSGLVSKPVKAVRTVSSDPGSPGAGEVWVVGTDLRYRNNNGGGQTETAERQARRDQNDGYAGLDGAALVNRPVKALRAVGSDPGSPVPGEVWVTGTDLKYRDNGGSPVTRAVVPASRQVLPGTGLSGGGALTGDVSLSISSFGGILSKELGAAGYSFSPSQILTHATFDAGPDGQILLTALRLPANVDPALETRALLTFENNTTMVLFNATNSPLDFDLQSLADKLTGDLSVGSANNGRSVRKVAFETRNTSGSSVGSTTVGPFRVRGFVFPRGAGGAL